MSGGDTTAAVATVKLAVSAGPGAPAPSVNPATEGLVPITFFHVPTVTTILHVSSPGQISLATIIQEQWSSIPGWNINSWYQYMPQQSIIRLGSISNDPSPLSVTLTAGGVVPSTPTSNAAPAPTSSSLPSVVPSTMTPTASAFDTSTTAVTTTANSTSTSQIPNAPGRVSKGLSSGTVAGTAVGCFIAGAIIATLVLWLCWGRRNRSPRVQDHEVSSVALIPQEKSFHATTTPLGRGTSPASPVSGFLPLPLEDKAITGEVSKISNSIKNHVQSYYQMGRISPGLIDLDDIQALGNGQSISAGTLSTLLSNPATREIALRFCIAWAVCSRILPGGDSRTSLLPVEIAGCYQNAASENSSSSVHLSASLARWRVMTAELLQATYVRDPFARSDSRNGNVQAAVVALDNILRPFADSRMDNGDRKRNLEEILKRSALFAFTLFSQPSTWGFDWEEERTAKSGELTIFPTLLQLSDENAQHVIPPRPFSEAVVRRLAE